MSYTLQQIASMLNVKPVLSAPGLEITHLSIDSRRLIEPAHSLFFAISGPRNDGHLYIQNLIQAGVKAFVVNKIPENARQQDGLNFIVVPDTIAALQQLCAKHRANFNYPVIAVTGSNGKTIIKEWLYQILFSKLRVVRNPKSYNSQVGVPLSVWQMDNTYDLGIFEAGISLPGEMEILEGILKPNIGIFTNLGDAHSENFENTYHKGQEKLKLFEHAGLLIARTGQALTDQLIKEWQNTHSKQQLLTWSDTDTYVDMFVTRSDHGAYQKIEANFRGQTTVYEVPFADAAAFENINFCILTALYLGFDSIFIAETIKGLQAVEMRLQKIEGINNNILINDTYNSDINSFEISVDFLTRQEKSRTNTVILTDILQTEKSPETLYEQVNTILKAKGITRFIGIGKDLERWGHLITTADKAIYANTDQFLSAFELKSFKNENILLKGARNFGLEQVVKMLEKQTHQTVFEINLSAIEHNFRYIKSLLPRNVKTMGMVKAYSYGSGSFEVAKLLQDAGVDYLAVAYTDEGVALRQKGISCPIMVMNPDEKAFRTMIEYQLEPEIYSFDLLKSYIKSYEHFGKSSAGIHIEFDTGMHRLGFNPDDCSAVIDILKLHPNLDVKSVFSHLAGSDETRLSEFTNKQIAVFDGIAKQFAEHLPQKPLFHILNSAGVFHYPHGAYDMVRLGIGLHGIDPMGLHRSNLITAGSLKSYISQIKTVKAGEGISYGLHSQSNHDRKIAIVAIGYADGLNRKLSNGNWDVIIQGKKATITGQICMDMFMADVTEINCNEGDEVLIFGKGLSIENMAQKIGTIPYEILTSVSQRVKRVYWYE